ncbi:MAG: hypothetical protein KGJ23_12965 [Euryarchaeota archaeon]|nr:hypothetical protein [Euryarchaeota archaeon]MDE1882024.1 hypothetical protein [Euryarchaeota archaeon]MDE2045524.1 hypothetical protein [Thermoplasmata archaeon]
MNGETPPAIDFGHLLNRAKHLGTQDLRTVMERTQEDLLDDLRRVRQEDGRCRYGLWGGYERSFRTSMGPLVVRVRRVRDRVAGKTFIPLLQALGLGKKRYTPDVRLPCAEHALTGTYPEASRLMERVLGYRIPHRTIWNFVKELAQVVERTLQRDPPPPVEVKLGQNHSTDSTFVRGRKRKQQLEVEAGIRQGQDHRVELVNVRVGAPPGASLEGEEVQKLTTDDAPGLRAFGAEYQQLCHVHFCRHLNDLLGDEGMSLEERERVVGPVRGLLAHLRNSVEFHRHDGNGVAVTERVRATLQELGALGHRLEQGGCPQSARFVLREMRALVVFAEVGGGLWMPATSNAVERVMGAIADRCKRKWAHWGSGLRNLVLTMLVRRFRPRVWGLAVRRYLRWGVQA